MDINLAFRPKGATHAGTEGGHGSWYKKNDSGDWLFIDMAEDGLNDRQWDSVGAGADPGYEVVELPVETRTEPPERKPVVDGGSAFPTGDNPESQLYAHPGMSLRDYFAAKAMQGQMQREKDFGKTVREQGFDKFAAHIAQTSYQLADAMLAARSA